jgi:hypothetical protein
VRGEKERKKKRWRERKKERKKGGGRERKKEREEKQVNKELFISDVCSLTTNFSYSPAFHKLL